MYDIFFDLNNMHQVVDALPEDTECAIGESWMLGASVDVNLEFDFNFPPAPALIPKKSDGCTCEKCKELFPYAEPNQKDGSFKCYSCRTYK